MARGDLPAGIVVDEKGKASIPPERFANSNEVQELCGQMIDSDRRLRAPRRARVDGLINGNRPISQHKLDKRGLSFVANANFLEAEGFLQAQQTPLFDLTTEVDHVVELTLDSDRVKGSKDEIDGWENDIQIEYTWLVHTRWRKGFNFHVPMQQLQMLKHGLGTHVWPTNKWIPRTPRAGTILFPDNAPINFEEDGEYFCVRDFLPAHVLYGFIRNEKAAQTLGWKPDVVWKALAAANKSDNRRGGNNIEETQRAMRNGDLGYSSQSRQAGVWLNYLYYKEIDTQKISLSVVTETPIGEVKDYLFKKRNMFDEWPLVLFNYDIGDGDINSLRGLGERTAVFFELSNRLKNAMASQVLISMFPMVKQMREDVDPDKLKLMVLGAMRMIPYGVEMQQLQFPALDRGPIALSQELRQTMDNNNQSMTGATPEPKDRETALSFSMRSQDKARVSNGLQSLYESNLQQLHDRMIRMVCDTSKGDQAYQKMAEEFRERCRKRGVPEAALKSTGIAEVREVTSSGSGSAAARLQGLMTLMQIVFPNTSSDRKINILRDLTANAMGGSKVDRYAPSLTDNEMPNNDDSMATVESSELGNGGDAQMNGKQDHAKHATNHLAKAQALMQACQSGQEDPAKCLTGLMKLLDHAGQHLAELQNNPTRKAEFDQLSQQWDDIAKFTQQLKGEVEAQANQPDPNQQLSEEAQVKMHQVDLKDAVDNKKADAGIVRQARKQAFSERLADQKTAHSIVLQSAKARASTNGAQPAKAAA